MIYYEINGQLFLFSAKQYGWMDGWVGAKAGLRIVSGYLENIEKRAKAG